MDIKWISTGLLVTGATALALQLPYYKFCFPLFVVAHVILAYEFSVKYQNLPLFLQNIYFIGLNSIGCYIWLFS